MKKTYIIIVLLSTAFLSAQIDNEANFYTAVANSNYNLPFSSDNDFNTDDSVAMQTAIDLIETNGGGTLNILPGNYALGNINLKSNVHLDFSNDVIIKPFYEIPSNGKLKNYAIFKLGSTTNPVENITISSSSGEPFTVDLTTNNNPNVAVVNLIKVSNFIIANINVLDNFTKFSAITTGGDYYNSVYIYPENGIVKDIDIQNAHYGYGTVQTQSAENILFKNLSSTGGATLRLETGYAGLNNLQGDNLPAGETKVGGLDKIVARNIANTNGNSAVMISPHAMHNGTVDVEGVTATSSGFAVRIENGFVSKKYDQTINLTDGTFEYVHVKNVTATYGNTAEIKAKHFKYYPSEITPPTQEASYLDASDTRVYVGAAVATVLAETGYACKNGVKKVWVEGPIINNGFLYQEDIIPAEYKILDCSTLSTSNFSLLDNTVQIFPNPSSNNINVKSKSLINSVEIYNISGVLVKKVDNSGQNEVKIELINHQAGVYLIKVFTDKSVTTQKLILN